jgi:nucleoside permease NupC
MDGNTEYLTMRSGVAVVVGVILVAFAIVLELMGLSMALSDPCSVVSGCQPLVDMRPMGWVLAVFALTVGLPAAWMVHWGSQLTSE